jgi:hypothetical protein
MEMKRQAGLREAPMKADKLNTRGAAAFVLGALQQVEAVVQIRPTTAARAAVEVENHLITIPRNELPAATALPEAISPTCRGCITYRQY